MLCSAGVLLMDDLAATFSPAEGGGVHSTGGCLLLLTVLAKWKIINDCELTYLMTGRSTMCRDGTGTAYNMVALLCGRNNLARVCGCCT